MIVGFYALAGTVLAAPARGQADSLGAVVVVNQLDREFLIWINGEPRGLVPAEGRATFDHVDPGTLSLLASGVGSEGIVAGEKRALAPGQSFEWTLYPQIRLGEEKGTAMLVLTNGLDQEVDVSLGGNEAGRLGPGARRTYPAIVAGDVTAKVMDLEGRVLKRFALTIMPGETMRWTIE